MSKNAYLIVSDLHLSYGDVEVLKGIDLTIDEGRIVALAGPSGCGKTSLLRCISGMIRPQSGTISCDGRVLVDSQSFLQPEHRRIGLVFQGNALFPHMNVEQNIAYGLYRIPKKERMIRVGRMIETLGLKGLEKRYPHELSGGQMQRVAVGRSLITDPRVLLLDEPFSDLDKEAKETLRTTIRKVLKDAGITTIMVSHHDDDIRSMAEETFLMENGKLSKA